MENQEAEQYTPQELEALQTPKESTPDSMLELKQIAKGLAIIAILAFAIFGMLQYLKANPAYSGSGEIISVNKVLQLADPVMWSCDLEVQDETGTVHSVSTLISGNIFACDGFEVGETIEIKNGLPVS